MRAYVMHRFGGPGVAAFEDVAAPVPRPRDVTIAVRAASLNPIDFKLRDGKVKFVSRPPLPIILGCDVAGVITAVGPEVRAWKVGDEVCARLEKDRMGGLAEQVCADESVVARRPASVGFAEAASLPLAGLTALQALREVAAVQPGQRVLVHAGAGGVGSLAIQLAKHLGAQVLATTSTKNVELVRSLGADLVLDYTQGPIAARDLDMVFDTLGGDSELDSLARCRPGGIVVGVSGMPDLAFARTSMPAWIRPAIWLITRRRRAAERKTGARFHFLFMRADGAQLAELCALVDAGTLRPLIHRTYPFAETAEAFAELERGRARGKIVVEL